MEAERINSKKEVKERSDIKVSVKIFSTLKNYKKEYLPKDILSGIIMAAVSIPISMGYAQTNAFTEPVTLMLAVSKDDHRVVDAWEVTQEEMENSCRSCEEYIGMDLIKYYKENQERIEKSQMMNQTMGRDSAKKQAFDMAVQQILGKLGK